MININLEQVFVFLVANFILLAPLHFLVVMPIQKSLKEQYQ